MTAANLPSVILSLAKDQFSRRESDSLKAVILSGAKLVLA
jgi:hypothetical protein